MLSSKLIFNKNTFISYPFLSYKTICHEISRNISDFPVCYADPNNTENLRGEWILETAAKKDPLTLICLQNKNFLINFQISFIIFNNLLDFSTWYFCISYFRFWWLKRKVNQNYSISQELGKFGMHRQFVTLLFILKKMYFFTT